MSVPLVDQTIKELDRWASAYQARAARKIRRSQLVDIQQDCLARLAEYRFRAPDGSSFRALMSNLAMIAVKESRDSVMEAWVTSTATFLRKQSRARDPLNWKGGSHSALYGMDLSLPRIDWPLGFSDR